VARLKFDSFESFTRFLDRTPALQRQAIQTAARFSAKALKINARKIIGSAKLADLAPSTQADRVRRGYTPNDPLKRTGELIEEHIESAYSPTVSGGAVAGVGSGERVQLYHEFGYIDARTGTAVPARPDLKIALEESMPEITAVMRGAVNAALGFSSSLAIVALPDEIVP
jgi:hypothetical protein